MSEKKEHSAKFENVKYFYSMGMWNDIQLRNAVKKFWITAKEYKEITGKEYE